jgi:hypothetical protein
MYRTVYIDLTSCLQYAFIERGARSMLLYVFRSREVVGQTPNTALSF